MLESVSAVEKEPQARATHVDTSFQTDSGTDADIDDVDPVPITFGKNRIRHLTNERSKFRRSLLKLIEDEVENCKEEDVSLQEIIALLMEGRRRGRKDLKEILFKLLELEKLNAT